MQIATNRRSGLGGVSVFFCRQWLLDTTTGISLNDLVPHFVCLTHRLENAGVRRRNNLSAMKIRKSLLAIVILLLLVAGARAEAPDYRGLIAQIDVMLEEALRLYREGNLDEAKGKVQDAYFQIFENLEGPIRINVSARKSYELESEFGDMRKMMIAGEPADDIEARYRWLMGELDTILPELEAGVVLVAEGTHGDPVEETSTSVTVASEPVEPTWQHALDRIRSMLNQAVASYEVGDDGKARAEILQAQFEGYKNTLLETAIRRHVSHARDAEHNSAFSSLVYLAKNDEPPDTLRQTADALLASIEADLPGLPLVDGAEVIETAEDQAPSTDWALVSAQLQAEIESTLDEYQRGDTATAVGRVQDTYFDIFEASGMEGAIAARDATLKTVLESHFARIVGQMKDGAPVEEVAVTLESMRGDLDRALELLGVGTESPWTLFLYSLLIILREGFEAILVVTALVAYLAKTGHEDKVKVIYNSVWVALGLSVVTAVLLEWVFETSGANQEILEGATMLLASAVLFSISYWLISKAEAQKWMAYIKEKVESSLSTGSLAGLWFASFLAVYREGAETVLFYKALTVGAGGAGGAAILAGFLVGCVVLIAVYLIMRRGAVRLPLRPFFMVTGALLYFMAFVFAGKGMMELIEGKVFEPSLIAWMPQWPLVGIFPYWQTVLPQLLLVMAAIAAGAALVRKDRTLAAQATGT